MLRLGCHPKALQMEQSESRKATAWRKVELIGWAGTVTTAIIFFGSEASAVSAAADAVLIRTLIRTLQWNV
jgi:hypothetical protein